jgi:hypothetical protein
MHKTRSGLFFPINCGAEEPKLNFLPELEPKLQMRLRLWRLSVYRRLEEILYRKKILVVYPISVKHASNHVKKYQYYSQKCDFQGIL